MNAYTLLTRHLPVALATMLCCATVYSQQIPKYNSNSAATATAYLDFDGQVVRGTAWNWDDAINARPAPLTAAIITEVFNRVSEDFRIFNINITTDSAVFKKAPPSKRVRVIVTPTSEWYGNSAGVSFVNSFTWGDDTPAWVFTKLLEDKAKYIAEAVSHEIGHTLGLQHQSTYTKSCELVAEYAEGKGTGEIGWAPIMGVGYYKNLTIWTNGTSIEGCKVIQNDISVISKGFNNIGLRADDHGNTRETSTKILLTNNNFAVNGIINNNTDRDMFRIVVPRRMKLKVSLVPNNVGANNSGANVDLYLTLLTSTGDTIGKYNPKPLLNAALDTALSAGTYYLGTDGVANQYVSDYGSVGLYALTGSLQNLIAAPTVLLKGHIRENYNVIKWDIEAGATLKSRTIEYSLDGRNYSEINDIPLSATSYAHKAPQSDRVYYRIRVTGDDGSPSFSNTVTLEPANESNVTLLSNLVRTHATVISKGVYSYQLTDASGRILQKGMINAGTTDISLQTIAAGVQILKVFNQHEDFQFRLFKQ